MNYKIYQNGLFLDESRAQVSVADRGFLVGEGLFETLRAYRGYVVFLDEHLERMEEAARLLKMELPLSLMKLKFLVYETLHLNRLTDAVIRIYLSPQGRSIGDLDGLPKQINLIISCRPFEPYPSEYYEKGAPCVLVKDLCGTKGLFSRLKSVSYLLCVLARRQARERGAFEGIFLNEQGHVTEGSGSNIFIVKAEKLFTPSLDEGVLAGVTRDQILKLMRRQVIPVEEGVLLPEDLYTADEIFITSTLKQVMPVDSVEGYFPRLPSPGPLTKKIMEMYRESIQWQIEQHPTGF